MKDEKTNLNDQSVYWNRVAELKTFTHPLNLDWLQRHVDKQAAIIDFGCGYGRIVKELNDAGHINVQGFDTSVALINRGQNNGVNNIFFIQSPEAIPVEDRSIDCIILFAVLTCIPENKAQQTLIRLLCNKLNPGGILYISDYYLQPHSTEMTRYEYLHGDKENYGVFNLPEGVTFRHHSQEWIANLFSDCVKIAEKLIEIKTMNGHSAQAFQLICRKTNS